MYRLTMHWALPILTLAVSMWCSTPAQAETTPGSVAVFPEQMVVKTLANGVRVVVIPLDTPGLVAVQTWMDVGSRNEVAPGMTGFAHFFEHLMFHGSRTLPRQARAERLLELGVDENAWTSSDETCFHMQMRADRLEEALAIEADRFANLHLEIEAVRREAGAVMGEHRKGASNPAGQLEARLWATAFSTHPYRHPVIGWERDIAAMPDGLSRAMQFWRTHYRPDRATLVIAGDVAADDALAKVERTYGAWRAQSLAPAPAAIPVEPLHPAPLEVVMAWPDPNTNPRVAIGWKAPGFTPGGKDSAVFDVLGELLTSSVAPLHRRLVEDEALAWSVDAPVHPRRDVGLFAIHAELRPGVDPQVVKAIILEEVGALGSPVHWALSDSAEGGMDLVESEAWKGFQGRVALSRERLVRDRVLSLQSPEDWAFTAGYHAMHAGDPRSFERHLEAIRRVTAEDVERVVKLYMQPRSQTITVLVPTGGGVR